jgi:hypothetical protein
MTPTNCPITSREYKLMLNTERFRDRQAGADLYWKLLAFLVENQMRTAWRGLRPRWWPAPTASSAMCEIRPAGWPSSARPRPPMCSRFSEHTHHPGGCSMT